MCDVLTWYFDAQTGAWNWSGLKTSGGKAGSSSKLLKRNVCQRANQSMTVQTMPLRDALSEQEIGWASRFKKIMI